MIGLSRSGAAGHYNAFISYRHGPDTPLAEGIRTALHRLAKPWYRLRALSVFLDRESLDAAPDLPAAIKDALLGSEYLIVIASPEARESSWVARELSFWLDQKPAERILVAVSDGELVWSDAERAFVDNERNPLPAILHRAITNEPRFVDLRAFRTGNKPSLRDPRFREEVATLAARLHGRSKDTLIGEDVRLFRQARRLATAGLALLAILTIAASAAAYVAAWNVGQARLAQGDALSRSAQYENARTAYKSARRWLSWTWQSTLTVDVALAHQDHVAVPPLAVVDRRAPSDAVAAVSPSGRWILVGGNDGVLRRADRDAGYVFKGIGRHSDSITAIAVSGDSRAALTAGRDGFLKLWDLEQGAEKFAVQASLRPLWSVAFSPDGKTALCGGDDYKIRVWDLESGELKAVLGDRDHAHRDWITALGFSRDGAKAFSASDDGSAKVWNTSDWSFASAFGPVERLSSAAITPDGARVWTVDDAGTIASWDTSTGKQLKAIAPSGPDLPRVLLPLPEYRLAIAGGAFGGAGLALVGGGSGSLALWDIQTGERLQEFEGHRGSVRTLSFSESDQLFVSTSDDGTIRLWPAKPPPSEFPADPLALPAVALHPKDPRIVAAGGAQGQMWIWDVATLQPLRELWSRGAPVAAVSFFPDGESVLVARSDGTLSTGSVMAEAPERSIQAHGPLATARTCPDRGGFIAVQEAGAVVRYTDGEPSELLQTGLQEIGVYDISPDCGLVIVGTYGEPVTVWDIARRVPVSKIGAAPFGFLTASFTADYDRVVLGTPDRTVELWQVSPPRKIWASEQLPFQPSALAVAASGRLVLAGDLGGHVHVIDTRRGDLIRSYRGHEGKVLALSIDASGKHGITGGVDGAARVWSFGADDVGVADEAIAARPTSMSRWRSAAALARRGVWQLAMALYGAEVQRSHPPSLELGLSLWMTGDLNKARDELEALGRSNPADLYTKLVLAAVERDRNAHENPNEDIEYLAFRLMGDAIVSHEEQMRLSSAGVRQFASFVDPYLDRAEVRMAARDLAGAVSDYSAALSLFPSDTAILATIYALRGYALQELGQEWRAQQDYARAVELDGFAPKPFFNRGNSFFKRHDYDRAIAEYSRAIDVSPEFLHPWMNRGVSRLRNGDVEGGLADLARARELAEKANDEAALAQAAQGIGLIRLVQGDVEGARKAFDESVHLGDRADARVGRSVANLVAGRWQSALDDLESVCSLETCRERELLVLARARGSREAVLRELSRLSASSRSVDQAVAHDLAAALATPSHNRTPAPNSEVERDVESCGRTFFRGVIEATAGALDDALTDLREAERACERWSWRYMAAAGMLRTLKKAGTAR